MRKTGRRWPVAGALMMALALAGTAVAGRSGWRWPSLPAGVAPPPVPADNAMTAARVALGRRLFHDADLSIDGTLACSGCHEQRHGFTDGMATHIGVTGEPGIRNVPGLANVAWRSPLTWANPDIATLEQQALVPMTGDHPVEMGVKGAEAEIARRIGSDACYRRMFAAAFPADRGRIDFAHMTAALAAFERTLISADSPYDRYRAGNAAALSPEARRGAAAFAGAGCTECHSGADLTDNAFHYTGTASPMAGVGYGRPDPSAEQEAQRFRTPPLRNVTVTGPWLHDGSAPTLDEAIRRHAPAATVRADLPAIRAFLDAQTDERFLRNPAFAAPEKACGKPI